MQIIARPAFDFRESNPYNWLLYSHIRQLGHRVDEYSYMRILRGNYDVWHSHWPEFFLGYYAHPVSVWRRLATTLGLLKLASIRGMKLIWTVHNLQSHDGLHPKTEQCFWKRFIPMLDGYICLSASGKKLALQRFPNLRSLPGYVIPHGHYRGIYPDGVSREAARRKLGLPAAAPVIAFIGTVKPYKNIPHLIRTFRQIENRNAILMVAGKPNSDRLKNEIHNTARLSPEVRLMLDYIPETDMQLYMRASDLIVLPFTEILNSGSAFLSLSFDKPILVPQKGALGELQTQIGETWVRTYTGELSPEILSESLAWAVRARKPEQPDLHSYDWEQIAIKTVAAYRDVCSMRTSA